MEAADLTNKKFGKLTAKHRVGLPNSRSKWYCECECGKTKIVLVKDLLSGHVKSCGCLAMPPKNIGKDILVELYVNQNMTIKQICSALGVKSPVTIAKYMDIHGIPRRNTNLSRKEKTMRGMSDCEFKKFLINQYAEKSLKQIACDLKITTAALRRYFIKYNIPLLSHADANSKFNSGDRCNNWKGGRRLSSEGYVMVYMPEHPHAISGAVYEHRYVMEQHIGRFLANDEVVHHINGNRADNRLENLMLLTPSQHTKLHSELRKKVIPNE